ncbi:acyltransferase family protein [Corynebacterium freiburgense]|uniref:acyltransferase family protein n=1 Tax=Corynebacterium freiburgense TaxID=556548 RepID=UPI000687AD9D|nr:acyltransferase family protein [Corynebacterium freiburgense]WJZ01713.1 O-acetyltransferase OatA [Corynebacterium freiburgense]
MFGEPDYVEELVEETDIPEIALAEVPVAEEAPTHPFEEVKITPPSEPSQHDFRTSRASALAGASNAAPAVPPVTQPPIVPPPPGSAFAPTESFHASPHPVDTSPATTVDSPQPPVDTPPHPGSAFAPTQAFGAATAVAVAPPLLAPEETLTPPPAPPAPPTPQKSARPRIRIRRVTGIDGLRGLAVLVVVIYHFFGDIMPGGFLGVDMFFVLSGFLITSLLVRERAVTGKIDLKDFWRRRVRRILPAAIAVLVIVTALAGLVGGDPAVGLVAQFFGTLLFVNNWVQIAESASYFADSGVQIFAHYWSLAVEEQFYVIWPLLFVFLTASGGVRRHIRWVIGGMILASFAWMLFLYDPGQDPTRVYYGTDTHSFGLLLGVLLALTATTTVGSPDADSWPADRVPLRRGAGVIGAIALIGLLLMVFFVHDTHPFTYNGGLLLASFLTAVVLTTVVREAGPVHTIMNWRFMRWLGERSFSLYLWHWPIIILLEQLVHNLGLTVPSWAVGLASFIISLLVCHWSYLWIETPIRRRGYKAILWDGLIAQPLFLRGVTTLVSAAVLLVAGMAIASSPRETELERDLVALAEQQEAASKAAAALVPAADTADVTKPIPGPQLIPTGDRITAVGDSVMLASLPALNEQFPEIHVDAAVSRTIRAAPEILTELEKAGALDPFVVLGFGTNAHLSQEHLAQVMEIVGPERVVILTMPYGDRSWIPHSHEEVKIAEEKYDNLYVADWCQRARADHALLRSDLIHPTEEGANAYVESIKYGLDQWANHRKIPIGECGV